MMRSYGNAGDLQGSDATSEGTHAVARLGGLWRRSLLLRPDGSRDTTTWVRWLQGRRDFVDLRQPLPLPSFHGVTGRAHLTREDCAWLARQEGFAGELVFDGRFFEWRRSIDYQPKSARADAGALEWEGEVLVERGRDVNYLEHWHRVGDAEPPTGALELCRATQGLRAMLVRVGNFFMFARQREKPAQPGLTLAECVSRASSLEEAQRLIDCEISFGEALASGVLRIASSTLPWRIGDVLEPTASGGSVRLHERLPNGETVTHPWEIAAREGQLDQLMAPSS
jgi:hypothetical protein